MMRWKIAHEERDSVRPILNYLKFEIFDECVEYIWDIIIIKTESYSSIFYKKQTELSNLYKLAYLPLTYILFSLSKIKVKF